MRIKKKGTRGSATSFITRKGALKKLQVSLQVFRKLCILKGIFPRDPKKKTRGTNKTYYFTKDIIFLSHDPLLQKFRDYRVLQRKIRSAKGKREWDAVKRLNETKEARHYTLDHIIKERYPTFTDALQDLDDPLCLVCTFINMPQKYGVTSARTENCDKLYREWKAYIIQTHSLRKVFVSIKGIYFQAEVQGNKITWIVPHNFVPEAKDNVDYRVLSTFLEFYESVLGFVLFRLYNSIGLHYPPKLDKKKENMGVGLDSLLLQFDEHEKSSNKHKASASRETDAQKETEKRIQTLNESELLKLDEETTQMEQEEEVELAEDEKEFMETHNKISAYSSLFKGCKFFLSREVSRDVLEFVIRSFGGEVSSEGPNENYPEKDPSITHQVVDRDSQKHVYLSRTYIQPQWVFDSVNELTLLPVEDYGPQSKLPPHLSPFTDDQAEGYVPERRQELNSLMQAAAEEVEQTPEEIEQTPEDMEEEFANELKAEVEGKEVQKPVKEKKRKAESQEEIHQKLAETVMTKKNRVKYRAMMNKLKKKEEINQKLVTKRQKLQKKEEEED